MVPHVAARLGASAALRIFGKYLGQSRHLALAVLTQCPEGLVSKLQGRPYRPGRSLNWVKVKNRQRRAFSRVLDQL